MIGYGARSANGGISLPGMAAIWAYAVRLHLRSLRMIVVCHSVTEIVNGESKRVQRSRRLAAKGGWCYLYAVQGDATYVGRIHVENRQSDVAGTRAPRSIDFLRSLAST